MFRWVWVGAGVGMFERVWVRVGGVFWEGVQESSCAVVFCDVLCAVLCGVVCRVLCYTASVVRFTLDRENDWDYDISAKLGAPDTATNSLNRVTNPHVYPSIHTSKSEACNLGSCLFCSVLLCLSEGMSKIFGRLLQA